MESSENPTHPDSKVIPSFGSRIRLPVLIRTDGRGDPRTHFQCERKYPVVSTVSGPGCPLPLPPLPFT